MPEAREHARDSREDPLAFLDLAAVFGADLAADERVRAAFRDALVSIREQGVRATLDARHATASDGSLATEE